MRVLIVYAFCTFGGVERVILNRVEAFRSYGADIKIDMVFLHDAGGFRSFSEYIESFGFSRYIDIHVFSGDVLKQYRPDEYDMVFNIDTPSVFEYLENCGNLYVECHTPYRENRTYLGTLPGYVRGVLVPSEAFRKEIRPEIPEKVDIHVLPNSVSEIFFDGSKTDGNSFFKRRPLAYMARLDELKNIEEALRIFKQFKDRDDIMFMIIGNGATDETFIDRLRKMDVLGKSFIRSKIHFDKVPQFLSLLKKHKGIFLSPSKGESFGMAVAEGIASSVPLLVSDIPPHRDLLRSDRVFLYPLGNIGEAKGKIEHILNAWDDCSQTVAGFADTLKHHSFIEAWKTFIALSSPGTGKKRHSLSFEQGVCQFFEKGKDSPMHETYVNYALSTNKRGEELVQNLSRFVNCRNKSYLDIGTAYGGYLVAFARQGCRPYLGMEIDENLVRLGKLNLTENGLDPGCILHVDICGPLPEALRNKKFDIITCTDVLEHVSSVSEALGNIISLMAPGGHVYLDVPNRYHVKNIISDPHFGIYGITLLQREQAKAYFDYVRGGNYMVSEYFELDYYLSFFPEQYYSVKKLHTAEIDVAAVDGLFRDEIENAYQSRISGLSVPAEIKDELIGKFSDYVMKYNSQIAQRNIDVFYAQNWRLLIQSKIVI